MKLSEAWANGAASYDYDGGIIREHIIVVVAGEDALNVKVGDAPVCRLTGDDFGDLLYLLSISPDEGWKPVEELIGPDQRD